MSDDHEAAPPALAPTSPPPPDPRHPVAPVVLMKGGTTSSAFDAEVRRASLEAEARRAEQEQDRAAADVPIEQGGAMRRTLDMGLPGRHPVAVLWCPTRDGTRERFMTCEVTEAESNGEVVLTLIMVCPRCVERGIPQDQAQMQIRSNHRAWYLDTRTRGHVFKDPDSGELHVLAGTVTGPGPYTCAAFNCGFKFSIDPKSPDYPGVSRLVLH